MVFGIISDGSFSTLVSALYPVQMDTAANSLTVKGPHFLISFLPTLLTTATYFSVVHHSLFELFSVF